VTHAHWRLPPPPGPARRQVHVVEPKVHGRSAVVQVDPPVGCVAGHVPHDHCAPPPPTTPAGHTHVVAPYAHGAASPHANPPGVHAPVGCVAGHAGHVVQVHTGVPPPAPPPQSHTTLPKVQGPWPAVHVLWLFGAVDGQPLPPPLLLPELLPLLLPLLLPELLPLPLPEPLPDPAPELLPELLPLLLPACPLLEPAPLLLDAVPSEPPPSSPVPALVEPPHPGATSAVPPTVRVARKRILRAVIFNPPPS
jgi:hypothetical protein